MKVTYDSDVYISRVTTLSQSVWAKPKPDIKNGYYVLDSIGTKGRVYLSDGTVFEGELIPQECMIGIDYAIIQLKSRRQTITIEGPFLPKKEAHDAY